MRKDRLKPFLQALPVLLLLGVAAHELGLFDTEAFAHGHFPDLGLLESDAAHLVSLLLHEDTRLDQLGDALMGARLPPTDPLVQKLTSLNHSQDILLGSAAQVKAELAVADMSGTFNGNTSAVRGTLTQLRVETMGLSSDIDALERDARARGISLGSVR